MARIPEVGDIIDDVFRVEEQFDQGNFGAIYRVRDMVDDRQLALKVLKPGPHDEEEVRQRFEREARLIYRLDHPHIVKLRYYGETDKNLPYMAMEFLHGTDLNRLLKGGYDLRDDQVLRIAKETLSALEAAHEVGIVHRDLKPANIFLVDDDDRGHVKVLDFGFAKSLEDESELTTTNTLVGSPAYMAPEMVHKKNVGPHSDLYSMGLIIGGMIAGRKIVQIENVYDTIVFQASDEPVELPEVVRDSPFAEIVERATQKPIDHRYASADEMLADLEALDVGLPGAGAASQTPDQEAATDEQGAPTVEQASPAAEKQREMEPTPLMVDVATDDETAPRARGFPPIQEVDPADEQPFPDEEAPTQEVDRGDLAFLAQDDPSSWSDGADDGDTRDGSGGRSRRGTAGHSATEHSATDHSASGPTEQSPQPPTAEMRRDGVPGTDGHEPDETGRDNRSRTTTSSGRAATPQSTPSQRPSANSRSRQSSRQQPQQSSGRGERHNNNRQQPDTASDPPRQDAPNGWPGSDLEAERPQPPSVRDGPVPADEPAADPSAVELDMERPTSSADGTDTADRPRRERKSGSSSLWTEILLGIGLGLVGLAVILFVVMYL